MTGWCALCDDRRGWLRDSGVWVCRQCKTRRHTPPPDQAGDTWLGDCSSLMEDAPIRVQGWCAPCRGRRTWLIGHRGMWECSSCGELRQTTPDPAQPQLDGVQVLEQAVGVLARVAGLPAEPPPKKPVPRVVVDETPRRKVRVKETGGNR